MDVTDPPWNGCLDLQDRYQAIRIEHWRKQTKTGRQSTETTFTLTSLLAERADGEPLNTLVRGH